MASLDLIPLKKVKTNSWTWILKIVLPISNDSYKLQVKNTSLIEIVKIIFVQKRTTGQIKVIGVLRKKDYYYVIGNTLYL